MASKYSVQFFTSLVEGIQGLVHDSINFSQFVEVTGYISVEIDNLKKERYVLSELLQSSGTVVSESFRVKAAKIRVNAPALSRQNKSGHKGAQKRPCPVEVVHRQYVSGKMNLQTAVNDLTKTTNPTLDNDFSSPKIPKPSNKAHRPSSVLELSAYDDEKESTKEITCYVPRVFVQSPDFPSSQTKNSEAVVTEVPSSSHHVDAYEEPQPTSHQAAGSDGLLHLSEEDDEVNAEDIPTEDSCEQNNIEGMLVEGSSASSDCIAMFSSTTQNLIRRSVRQFKLFLYWKYTKEIDLVACPPSELEALMMEYFTEAKKKGGGEFRAKSLKCMMQRLDMFLRDGGYPYSLFKDDEFKTSRDYIKRKMLTECGSKCLDYVLVDDLDVETLFQMNQLGSHNLEVLTNTMWFMNSLYLRVRTPNQHYTLKWGDIVLKTDGDQDYLERRINPTFSFQLKATPENPIRCFVNLYEQFKARRPKLAMDSNHSFYLKHNKPHDMEHLYLPGALPHYILGGMWRRLQTQGGLPLNKKLF